MDTIFYKGTLMALGAVAVVGLAMLLPRCRAWMHVLLGNYMAAAAIYERRLARHPHRFHLYLKLAGLYILAGRRDAPALTAYRIIWEISQAIKISVESKPVNNGNGLKPAWAPHF